MTLETARRPQADEHAPYYARYVALVPDGDVVDTLRRQLETTIELLRPLSPEQAERRYAPGKWSLKQVVGHVADSERVFGYRALAFARGESNELPGFDENVYAEASPAVSLALPDVLDDLAAVRRSTVSLLTRLVPDAWSRQGLANKNRISVRALAWVIAGHERHHVQVLRERYLDT